jgi:molybdopterin-guanine dinucleotide biosynthesis protein A
MSTPPPLSDVTLAILAGGEGSRMGKPKGQLRIDGKPILAYLLDRFTWPGPTLLVTAPGREKPPAAGQFDREVIDAAVGEGPLRGVLTALQACDTDFVFITTVDMPGVGLEQVEWLFEQMQPHRSHDGIMCRRGGRIEPFPSIFHKSAAHWISAFMDGGERSVQSLANSICTVHPCPDWPKEVWANLNCPDDLAKWNATL